MKNILIFGSTGMLGKELSDYFSSVNNIGQFNVIPVTRDSVRILNDARSVDYDTVRQYIRDQIIKNHVTHVINCVAHTDTKSIEQDKDAAIQSFTLNALFPQCLAKICAEFGLHLVHISTDYVFSENSVPFSSGVFPVTTYGNHKLMAELFIQNEMKSNYTILRVGWLYGIHREKSFVHKFLRNCINRVKTSDDVPGIVEVVDNQTSTPTSCRFVAQELAMLIQSNIDGVISISPEGAASRYEFAVEILNDVKHFGDWFDNILLKNIRVESISPWLTTLSYFDKKNFTSFNQMSWQSDLKGYLVNNRQYIVDFIEREFSRT